MHYYWPREPQGRELENLTQLFKVLGGSFPYEGSVSDRFLRGVCH